MSLYYRDAHVLVPGICAALLLLAGLILYVPLFAQSTPRQFKEYNEQYGRFSIQVPNDWKIDSPSVKQDSDTISFEPNNGDDILLIIVGGDRHTAGGQDIFEQVVREQNAATVRELPGATLIQDTDCTKYVIDDNKACSMIYTTTTNGYTQKEMDIDFRSAKQEVLISLAGSAFDKYVPIVNQMLNSMKVS